MRTQFRKSRKTVGQVSMRFFSRKSVLPFLFAVLSMAVPLVTSAKVTTMSGICWFPATGGKSDGNSWGLYDGVYIQGYNFAIPDWLHFSLSSSGSVITEKIIVDPNPNTYKRAVLVPVRWSSGQVTYYTVEQEGGPQPNYCVAFKANGGRGRMAKQKMVYGKSVKLRKNKFKRSGWIFIGWAKSKTGSVAYKNAATVKNLRSDGKTTILYAKWAKKTYKVRFSANGGKGSMSSQKMTYGKGKSLAKNSFTRKGYTFVGWAKSKNGSVVYKNGQTVKNLTRSGGTVRLFAVWRKTNSSESDVNLHSGGGNVTETSSYWFGQYNLYMSYYNSWKLKADLQQSHIDNAQAQVNSNPQSIMARQSLNSAINLKRTYLNNAEEWLAKARNAKTLAMSLSAQGK